MIIWRIMTNDEDKQKDSVEDHEIDLFIFLIYIFQDTSVCGCKNVITSIWSVSKQAN